MDRVFEPLMGRQGPDSICSLLFGRGKDDFMKTRLRSFFLFLALLLTEILIGVFLKGGFIRAYGGDILVLPLLYAFMRIFFPGGGRFTEKILPFLLFLLGVCVEFLQGMHIADRLHITSRLIRIVVGSTFDIWDIACYFAGMLLIYLFLYVRSCIFAFKH